MAHRIGGDPVSFHTPAPEEGQRPAAPTKTRLTPPGDRVELPRQKLPSELFKPGALDGKSNFVKIGNNGQLELTRNRDERAHILDVFSSINDGLDHSPQDRAALPALLGNIDALHAQQTKGFWNYLRSLVSPSYRNFRGQVDQAHSELRSAIGDRIMQRAQLRKEGKDLVQQSTVGDAARRTSRAEKRTEPKPVSRAENTAEANKSTRDAPALIGKSEKAAARSDAAVRRLSQNVSLSSLGEAMESLREVTMQLRRLRQAKIQATTKGMDASATRKIDGYILALETKHQDLTAALTKAGKK